MIKWKYKFIKLRIIKIVWIILSFCFVVIGVLYASNIGPCIYFGYQIKDIWWLIINKVGVGQNCTVTEITDMENLPICKKISSNTLSYKLFIPTHTTGEWQAFLNNLPSWLTLESCGGWTEWEEENSD